ncbi:hypothetical protein SAMN05445756_0686 [Kytococcus aerolatus]|uniref:Uncharacterized protein n=1 Tax=Kytococcus aerolatus TaxID=592308 RepID=A0A212T976_9MICO|nr:hypothetical protein [Kytococcus aerolatus]SNC62401.1 hypothetical protein SAMN05445756_0686 [Kytococcus aerolatus]
MSTSLVFWAGGDDLDAADVYAALDEGRPVDGVTAVSRDEIVDAFADGLPGWSWDHQFLHPPGADPEGTPAVEVYLGDQHAELTTYGAEGEQLNASIEMMRGRGYRLFDPQLGTRFA